MYYIIQDNIFKDENDYNLVNTLEKFDLPFERIVLEKGDKTVKINTNRRDIFPFGSVRLATITKDLDWYPGSQMCENHDYNVYSKYYKDNLLNYDSKVVKFETDMIKIYCNWV
jgi:hypothetical protein